MENENQIVCVAVVQCKDRRYVDGYRLRSFHIKQELDDFLKDDGRVHSDEALVILKGGSHKTTTVDDIMQMPWILETV